VISLEISKYTLSNTGYRQSVAFLCTHHMLLLF